MKHAPKSLWILIALLSFAGILKATLPPITIGNWTGTTTSLAQARANASAVLLSNGSILFAGGDVAGVPQQSAEFFGTDGSVSSAGTMNVARSRQFAVVMSDGRVLVGGGNTTGVGNTPGGATVSAEIYDPSAGTWTATGPMNSARANATAAVLPDGRVVIAGGDNSGAPSNTIEIYNPSSSSFSVVSGTLSSPRTQHAMAVLQNGQVLIIGGFDGTNPLASTDVFDPMAGTIVAGPPLATARYAASATTLMDGQVAVIGGAGSDGNGGITDLASIELFDPTGAAFSTLSATLTTARQGHQAFLLPNNNNVLIVGGTTTIGSGTSAAEQAIASSELLTGQVSITTGAWTYTTSVTGAMNTARAAFSGSANQLNGPTATVPQTPGLVIVGGGNDASGNTLASTEAYGYPTVQTDQSDYPPGSTVTITGSGFKPGESVNITLVESPLIDTHGPYAVTADGNGNFTDSSFATDVHDVNVRFWLSAAGSQSGLVAQNTFTDAGAAGNGGGSMSILPTSVTAGSTGNTLTFTFQGVNGKSFGAGSQVTVALPVGWSSFQTTNSSGPGFVSNFQNSSGTSCLPPTPVVSVTSTLITVTQTCNGNDKFSFKYSNATAQTNAGTATFTTKSSDTSSPPPATLTAISPQPTVTVNAGTAASITATAGTPQSTPAGNAFTTALQSTVTDSNSNPVSGATVTFTAPTSGASGKFANNTNTTTATTNASGVATASTFTAITTTGSYNVTASVAGVATPADFSLTNTAGAATKFLVSAPANATAGTTFSVTVTAQDSSGNTATNYTGTVKFTLGTTDTGATVPANYTFLAGDAGVHIFTNGFTLTKVTGSQTVVATDTVSSGVNGTSGNINVGAATASKLVFGQQPSNTPVSSPITPAVTVLIQDQFGNTTTSTASVSIAIGTNPSGGTLSGTTSVSAVSGTATFSTLSIDKSGNGYTLTASSGGLTGATSSSFNVNAANGSGTMIVSPATTPASSTGNAFTFTFTANNGDFPSGSQATIVVPAVWTKPNTNGNGAGMVSISSSTCTTASISNVTSGGTGPWTITISMQCANGNGFSLLYDGNAPGVTAPATQQAYAFTTQTQSGSGGTLTNIASSPVITVDAPNGSGTMVVAPTTVNASTTGNNLGFTFTASNGDMPAGSLVNVTVPAGWSAPQTTNNTNPGFVSIGASTCSTANIASVTSGVVSISAVCANGNTFVLNYASATAPSTTGASVFTTQTRSGNTPGSALVNIASSPTVTVNTRTTSTSVSLVTNPVVVGQATTVNVSVTDNAGTGASNPGGSVSFTPTVHGSFTGTCTLGQGGNPTGTVSCQVSYTPSDTTTPQNIAATYTPSDSIHATSNGNANLTVNSRSTSTSVSCSPNPDNLSTATTCTATVTDTDAGTKTTPGGTVNFSNTGSTGNFNNASCALSSGSCFVTYTPTVFGTGTHRITGSYGGDTTHATSSNFFDLTVQNPATTTMVTSSSNPSTYGTPVTFTATVTSPAGTPTGSVTFYDGGTDCTTHGSALGTAVGLNASGVASLTTSALSATTHTIVACYMPTGIFQSSSGIVSQMVNTATLNITANDQTKGYGQTLSLGTTAFTTSGLVGTDSVTSVTLTSAGTPATAAAGSYAIVPSAPIGTGLGNYTIKYVNGTLSVTAAMLTITANDAAKTFGTTLTFAGTEFMVGGTLFNGDSVASVTLTSAGAASGATVVSYPIMPSAAMGTGLGNYTIAYANGTLTVIQATPSLNWNTPAAITYGTALGAAQLDATSTIGGSFTYTPGPGSILSVGTGENLTANFVPTDTVDYTSNSVSVQINVLKATPTIVWNNPADITYPTALSGTQLNALALPPPSALTGWFKGEGNTNDSVAGNNGTIQGGVTYAPGFDGVGQAFNFNGSSGITVPNNPGYDLTASGLTASFWVQGSQTNSGPETILEKAPDGSPIWSFQVDSSTGHMEFDVDQGMSPSYQILSNANVLDGNFHYITGAWDGSSTLALYVDGISQGTATVTTFGSIARLAVPSGLNIGFGLSGGAPGQYFTGVVDEVQIFDLGLPAGTYAYTPSSGTVLNAGMGQGLSVIFTPTDTTDLSSANQSVKINVTKANQVITFGALGSKIYGDAPLTVSATGGGSSNPVTFTAVPMNVCTSGGLNGSTISITGAGLCTVTADQAGDTNYNNAASVPQSFTIAKANQTISVTTHAPASAVYNTSFNVVATASSGLTVAYSSSGVCSNAGATFTMTSGTGTCTVQYDQAGDPNYNAATQVTENVTAQKANQTITVTTHAPASAVYNTSFTVVATSSSNLTVTYSPSGVCTNLGATFTMTSGTGTCTVQYDQAGDANYNAATQVTENVTAQKANQTITVTTHVPAAAVYNTSFNVVATASSNLAVAYSASGVCTNVGATFTMTSGTGTCTVQYDQPGNANYNPATQVTESVMAQKANQTITVSTHAPASAVYNTSFNVVATASSNLVVTYSSYGACTNSGATFTMTSGTGTCAVQYDQAGDANYNAATQVTENVTAQKANQTITVSMHAPASAVYNTSFNVVATASSNLAVAYSASGVCTNVGATFTMTSGTGTCTVQYDQPGNANYNPATQVTENVTAQKANQTITVSMHAPASAIYNTSFNVVATASSGLTVAYSSSGVCSNAGVTFTMTSGTGTCTVQYDQAGDANYNPATQVTENVMAQKANAVVVVTPYSVTYDGNPHTATVTSITGVNGEMGATVGTVDVSNTTHTPAGMYVSDSWSFTGTANYNNTSGTVPDSIAQAPSTTTVYCPMTVTYNSLPQTPCMAAATGVGPINQAPPVTYTANVIAGMVTASATYFGDTNHLGSSGSALFTIAPASTSISVSSSPNPSNWMQVVTITATVVNGPAPNGTGTPPLGSVNFYNAPSGATCITLQGNTSSSVLIGTGALAATADPNTSTATTALPTLPVGTDTILACYNNFNTTDPGYNGNFVASSGSTPQAVIAAPIATIVPNSVSFGTQAAGTKSGAQSLTICNGYPNNVTPTSPCYGVTQATAALSISSIAFGGNNPGDFIFTTSPATNCGSSIAIGGSCTVNIQFAPQGGSSGVESAFLNVTDNNGNVGGSVQSASVSGAGLSTIGPVAGSFSTDAIFATNNNCSAINISGNGTVDGFGGATNSGNVGTNGNVSLSGNPVINGTVYSPFGTTGSCGGSKTTGLSTSGKAQATGGVTKLPGPVTYPLPPTASPAPLTTTQNISGSCGSIFGCTNNGNKSVSLAPGQYGNLTASGGTTVHVTAGTYNLNSLALTGNSVLYVDSGPVVINLAGAGLSASSAVMDSSGGSIVNPSGKTSNLQIYYPGSNSMKLSGGSGTYALVYAPNAGVNITGGSHFYGSIVANSLNSSGNTAIHGDLSAASLAAGDTLWFSSSGLKVQGLPTNQTVKLYVTNANISFTANGSSYSVAVPNAVITFSSTATSASTTWDSVNNRWSTLVPMSSVNNNSSIHTFFDAVAFQVPASFTNGIQNVTWQAAYSTTSTGLNFNWQWGAAAYSGTMPATGDYSSFNVTPLDSAIPAGTPVTYESNLLFGDMGPGYVGMYQGSTSVVPTIAPASIAPSSYNFGTVSQSQTGSAMMSFTLSNNQSTTLTMSTTQNPPIVISGTNKSDFTLSPAGSCPAAGGTLAGGSSCTINITFTPSTQAVEKAKLSVYDNANNSPQTVFLTGTGIP